MTDRVTGGCVIRVGGWQFSRQGNWRVIRVVGGGNLTERVMGGGVIRVVGGGQFDREGNGWVRY